MNKRFDISGQLNGLSFFTKKYTGMMTGFTMMLGFTMIYLLMF